MVNYVYLKFKIFRFKKKIKLLFNKTLFLTKIKEQQKLNTLFG